MSVFIRLAQIEDAIPIAEIHILSWQHSYKGIIHQSYLDHGFDVTERTNRWKENLSQPDPKTFVALTDKRIVGFASIGSSREKKYSNYAELYAIYFHPEFMSKGYGTALLTHALNDAKEQGFTQLFTTVLKENKPARNFYERNGATLIQNSEHDMTIDEQLYPVLEYTWT